MKDLLALLFVADVVSSGITELWFLDQLTRNQATAVSAIAAYLTAAAFAVHLGWRTGDQPQIQTEINA